MRMKSSVIVAVVAAVVVVGGGVATAAAIGGADATPEPTPSVSAPVADSTETPTPTASATPDLSTKTDAGEVCDPHNLNDMICLAFYPDLAVVNMTSGPRAQEPLRSLPDADKVTLAHKACDTFAAGGSPATVTLIGTQLDADKVGSFPADINNTNIFQIGALAYCNDHITEQDGTHFRWTLDTYRSMGEKAAKDSFSGGHIIQP